MGSIRRSSSRSLTLVLRNFASCRNGPQRVETSDLLRLASSANAPVARRETRLSRCRRRESPASDSSAPPQATLETYLRLHRPDDVIAVAWDQQNLDHIQRVLDARTTRDPATAKTETEGFRQANADADWDTVKRRGGLDPIVDKIDQTDEKTATLPETGQRESQARSSAPNRARMNRTTRVRVSSLSAFPQGRPIQNDLIVQPSPITYITDLYTVCYEHP